MIEKMKKIVLGIITGLILLFTAPIVSASDLRVECDQDGCTASGTGDFLSGENIYPGWDQTKIIEAVNKYSDDRNFALQVVNFNDPDGLGEKFVVKIEEVNPAGSVLFENSLKNLYDQAYFELSKVGSDRSREYSFTIKLPTEAGNKFKNKSLDFDLQFGFDEDAYVNTTDFSSADSNLTNTSTPIPATAGLVAGAQTTLSPTETPVNSPAEFESGETEIEQSEENSNETEREKVRGVETEKTRNWRLWIIGGFLLFLIVLLLIFILHFSEENV